MPRIARAVDEVEGVKLRILESALQLLIEDGFVHFSIRKLAARIGMTPANIYNYVTNKDELYLLIQTKGFEMLYELLNETHRKYPEPEERIEGMIRAYLNFGIGNPEYYEIMFSRNTPKYMDYVGTATEPIAFHEKQTALKSAEIAVQALSNLTAGVKGIHMDDIHFRMLQIWCVLNGMVNLVNSRVLQEVESDTEAAIDRMVQDLMKTVRAEYTEK